MTRTKRKREPVAPACGDCGALAELTPSNVVYPRTPQFWGRWVWLCRCGAYVGCHPGTKTALGAPASRDTRAARSAAHAAFDPLWRAKMVRDKVPQKAARKAGYMWLAAQLKIDPKDCHIGMMTADRAWQVVRICRRYNRRKAA